MVGLLVMVFYHEKLSPSWPPKHMQAFWQGRFTKQKWGVAVDVLYMPKFAKTVFVGLTQMPYLRPNRFIGINLNRCGWH